MEMQGGQNSLAKRGVDFLEIRPDSSPADIELNERWSRMPTEELTRHVIDGFLYNLTRQSILPGYEDLQEKQVFWWLRVLRRVFAGRQNEFGNNNWQDFKLCPRCLYLCSLFGKTSSKFNFPKFNKKFWEEIMEDWRPDHYADSRDKEIFSCFLNCFVLASEKEKKIMDDVLRERLKGARPNDVEGLIGWLWRSKEPETLDGCPDILLGTWPWLALTAGDGNHSFKILSAETW